MAFSTKSFYTRITSDSSRGYAKAAADNSYKYYNNMTWSFWVMAGPSINKNLFSMWEDTASNNRSWIFSAQADGTLRTIFSWDGTSFSLHKTATAVFDYSWKHIMISFANGTQTVYVNNVLQTMNQTIAWGGGAAGLYAAGQQVIIGSKNPAAPPIDESPGGAFNNFSMWNVVLNSSQRSELYNNGVPANLASHSAYSNCTNWWRLDQSDTAPTLVDTKNGSGSNMTITASGTSGAFAASNAYPTYSQDPGIANVRLSTTYVSNGDSLTGTCAVPTAANTKTGVATDNTTGTYDGSDRWTDPLEVNVLSGVAYKANSTTNNKTGSYVPASATATEILDNQDIETGYSVRESMRLILAAMAGKLSGSPGGPILIRNVTDTKTRINATVDASGNRTAVTHDVS